MDSHSPPHRLTFFHFCPAQVITSAQFHPSHCNIFMYGSSRGSIKLGDMRASALCDTHSKGRLFPVVFSFISLTWPRVLSVVILWQNAGDGLKFTFRLPSTFIQSSSSQSIRPTNLFSPRLSLLYQTSNLATTVATSCHGIISPLRCAMWGIPALGLCGLRPLPVSERWA